MSRDISEGDIPRRMDPCRSGRRRTPIMCPLMGKENPHRSSCGAHCRDCAALAGDDDDDSDRVEDEQDEQDEDEHEDEDEDDNEDEDE